MAGRTKKGEEDRKREDGQLTGNAHRHSAGA
jgi:hypothetical protein